MLCVGFCIVVTWYVLASGVTYVTYGYDKRRARADRWRVTEKTLHWMEMAGGWPGAMAAQRHFKHKRRKADYMLVFRLIVAVHALVWGLAVLLWWVW